MKARFSITNWLRQKRPASPTRPGDFYTVLFDLDGKLMVWEGGVWKVFELDPLGPVKK